jgi:predicted ATPase
LITRIEVRNFGCFDDSPYVLNLSPETFIVGPNNVGKSTFIAAYEVVAHKGFNYPLTKFSSYEQASFGHMTKSAIIVKVCAEFSGKKAQRTIEIKDTVSSKESGSQEVVAALDNLLKNTWYLTSMRSFVPSEEGIGGSHATLNYIASNVVAFLLERWTSRDPNWKEVEEWLRIIDPSFVLLKTPLRGSRASIETTRKYTNLQADVNIAFQGGGIQRALQIVSAVIFSPRGSVIMIEEPEMNLHKDTQEILVDLFNKATNEWDKQIIITTHSWDMILPIISDIGPGSRRGAEHVKADPDRFRLVRFRFQDSGINIEDYDIAKKTFRQIKDDFKLLWG